LILASRYEELLTRSRGFRSVELDRAQLRAGVQLRALYRLRTPEALQLAAAISQGCSSFVTNDRDLPVLPNLRIIQPAARLSQPLVYLARDPYFVTEDTLGDTVQPCIALLGYPVI
jgi:hypothetical protein